MIKPTILEIAAEIKLKGYNTVNAEEFWYHYDAIGWVVGKARTPMKIWRSSLAGWHIRNTRSTTSFNAVKQRDEAYVKSKAVHMKTVKAKPVKINPKIKILVDEQFKLQKSMRGKTASQRCITHADIRDIGKQIQVIKDKDIKLGELIK